MNKFSKTVTALTFSLATSIVLATPPKQLITHNTTDLESNAYIAGIIPSQYPTKPHSDTSVSWPMVKMACFGHVTNGKCWAIVKMDTNTSNPFELGKVSIDMETGMITPAQLTANGYTLTVVGLGETTLSKTNS